MLLKFMFPSILASPAIHRVTPVQLVHWTYTTLSIDKTLIPQVSESYHLHILFSVLGILMLRVFSLTNLSDEVVTALVPY